MWILFTLTELRSRTVEKSSQQSPNDIIKILRKWFNTSTKDAKNVTQMGIRGEDRMSGNLIGMGC